MAKISKSTTSTSFLGNDLKLTKDQIDNGSVLAERQGRKRVFSKMSWDNLPADKNDWKIVKSEPEEPEKATKTETKSSSESKGDKAAPKSGKGSKAKQPEEPKTTKENGDQEEEKDQAYIDAVSQYHEMYNEDPGEDLTTDQILEAVENAKKGEKE